MKLPFANGLVLCCEVRSCTDRQTTYTDAEEKQLSWSAQLIGKSETGSSYKVTVTNDAKNDFEGVIHFKVSGPEASSKFFMPGYMYNRNTADMPYSNRKCFPRIKKEAGGMPESAYFMTRADRLSLPVSLIFSEGHVYGVSASPYAKNTLTGEFIKHCGFTCNIDDCGCATAGYTLGYENAPWLFVQSSLVMDRAEITKDNSFLLKSGESYSFEMTIYDYFGDDERAIYRAINDVYNKYHESPRTIPGMDIVKAITLLSEAIRDYGWLEDERIYSGFIYDPSSDKKYNRIPSISWTNGLAIAVPMLMTADRLGDEKAREQSIVFINETIENSFNPKSGFMYESVEDGHPTVKGWWYDGMRNKGHSSYINGQAVYYILKAYLTEKVTKNSVHGQWIDFAKKVIVRMNEVLNEEYEYPFAMSEETGEGIEYDSMGGAWFLAATAFFEEISGDRQYMDVLLKSEEHYYEKFVKKAECYGGPLDTDKAVDDEGILSYIRAVKSLHSITQDDLLLDHLKDALDYEFTFKLGYNTPVSVRPLSDIGWSSCGGSITSTANPHIHPMSSAVIDEMRYYLSQREDGYVKDRMEDTIKWSLQTFNTYDGEYGYGKVGWMSERFCFCEGLLTETYPDGEVASTWFALMPWASASILEGLANIMEA